MSHALIIRTIQEMTHVRHSHQCLFIYLFSYLQKPSQIHIQYFRRQCLLSLVNNVALKGQISIRGLPTSFKFNECKFTTKHWQYSTEIPLKRHLIKSLLSRLFSSVVFCLDPTLTQRQISRVKQIKFPRLVGGSQTNNVQNIVRHTHSKPIGTPIETSE